MDMNAQRIHIKVLVNQTFSNSKNNFIYFNTLKNLTFGTIDVVDFLGFWVLK